MKMSCERQSSQRWFSQCNSFLPPQSDVLLSCVSPPYPTTLNHLLLPFCLCWLLCLPNPLMSQFSSLSRLNYSLLSFCSIMLKMLTEESTKCKSNLRTTHSKKRKDETGPSPSHLSFLLSSQINSLSCSM